jgi:cysteine synthase
MKPNSPHQLLDAIGNTPLLKIKTLSELTGCEIFAKCEHLNPGGSVKDRASKQMILDAISSGELRSGMEIVEGTAGNTGIGLAWLGAFLGYPVNIVMPKGQTLEKQRMVELYGARLLLVDPVPFKDPKHFYHTAAQMAHDQPKKYWWANQFENLSNSRAHYLHTGKEIYEQLQGKLDWLVSVAGSGGTIAGTGQYLKEQNKNIKVRLIDPMGSGLTHYFKNGEFKSEGSSITEGIGIMRLVANFKNAQIDDAITLPDSTLINMAHYLRTHEGLAVGLSSALNLAGAVKTALDYGPGLRIVTFLCDLGERSYSKLYNAEFLKEKGLHPEPQNLIQSLTSL